MTNNTNLFHSLIKDNLHTLHCLDLLIKNKKSLKLDESIKFTENDISKLDSIKKELKLMYIKMTEGEY